MPIASRSPDPATSREWILVVSITIVLILLLTWPLIPALTTSARLDSGDGRFSVWNVAWVDHALLTDPRHLFDANIFSPHTGTLAYSEPNLVAGVLGLPAYVLTHNAVAAHNFAVVVSFLLASILTWILVRRLTGSSGAGFVAAILFTFCPFVQAHTAHVQLLMTFVIPLVMLAFHRLHDRPTVGRALVLGASLTVAGLACGYYGIYGGIFLGLAALAFGKRDLRYWLNLALAAGTAALLVWPIAAEFLRARDIPQLGSTRGIAGVQISADLNDYLSSPSVLENTIWPRTPTMPPHEFLAPGIVALLLGAAAFLGRSRTKRWAREGTADPSVKWRYLTLTALAVWATLGPGYGLYAFFMRVVPGIDFVRAPCRFGILVAFGVAVIAGFGAKRLIASRAWVLALVVVICGLDRYVGAWPLQPDPIPEVYRVLATLPRGVVVDFPFPYVMNDLHHHTRAMYYSTADWMPRVNGYSDLLPSDFLDIAAPINEFPDLGTFPLMQRYHVRYVIWNVATYHPGTIVYATLTSRFQAAAPYMRPIYRDDNWWLYEIVAWPSEAAK